eukprot:jgi/Mesvir1/15668/Mv03269-RA.1
MSKQGRGQYGEPSQPGSAVEPVLVASFSYKGGCGKSTVSLNLGAELASQGIPTLLVDCDEQCNLSTFFNPEFKRDNDAGNAAEEEDEISSEVSHHDTAVRSLNAGFSASIRPRKNVYDYSVNLLRPGCFQKNGKRFPTTLKDMWEAWEPVVEARERMQVVDMNADDSFNDLPKGLYLLPGDPLLMSLELEVSGAMSTKGHGRNPRPFRALSAFRRMVVAAAKNVGAHMVICDFGPSAGVLNQNFVMSCDLILPVFLSDFFSSSAVYGLLHSVYPPWLDGFEAIKSAERSSLHDKRFAYNVRPPNILPFMMNSYTATVSGRVLSPTDSNFLDLVSRVVNGIGGEEPLEPEVKGKYFPARGGAMVGPFLPSVPKAMKVAQEVAHPATLIDEDILVKYYEVDGVGAPEGAVEELKAVKKSFRWLADLVLEAANRRRRELGLPMAPVVGSLQKVTTPGSSQRGTAAGAAQKEPTGGAFLRGATAATASQGNPSSSMARQEAWQASAGATPVQGPSAGGSNSRATGGGELRGSLSASRGGMAAASNGKGGARSRGRERPQYDGGDDGDEDEEDDDEDYDGGGRHGSAKGSKHTRPAATVSSDSNCQLPWVTCGRDHKGKGTPIMRQAASRSQPARGNRSEYEGGSTGKTNSSFSSEEPDDDDDSSYEPELEERPAKKGKKAAAVVVEEEEEEEEEEEDRRQISRAARQGPKRRSATRGPFGGRSS